MSRLKKLTALLVSAALAFSVLAACGNGSRALSHTMADLLSGLYDNVSVEVDSTLTAALKKASAAGGTQEEVLAALLAELNLSGVRLTLRQLEEGQQGDRGVELVFQPGTDPDAAARTTLNSWASAFGALPDDGSYTARVAMIEADGGYYIAVDVEVTQAGAPDKSDPRPDYTISTEGSATTYTVYSAAGLQEWAEAARAAIDNKKTAVNCTLGSNITLTGTNNWTPIGNDLNKPYTGTFKGDGHKISGLNVNDSYGFAGLFGQIGPKGTVQDLTLDAPQINNTSGSNSSGAVVGKNEGGFIDNCHVTGGNIGGSTAGGVVGNNVSNGKVTACSSTGMVTSTSAAGGVVGKNEGTVTACYATGTVTSTSNAGGVVGWNDAGGTVTACYATGAVTSTYGSAGGVVGQNDESCTVTACYHANGQVKGSVNAGGVAGSNAGTVKDCYAAGAVTATNFYAGGVVGNNSIDIVYDIVNGTVQACYWSGTVEAEEKNQFNQGIGYGNQADSVEYKANGSHKVDDIALAATMETMNQALSGEGWHYIPGTNSPLALAEGNP